MRKRYAVVALLAVLADPKREAEFATVETALVAFGADALMPLAVLTLISVATLLLLTRNGQGQQVTGKTKAV